MGCHNRLFDDELEPEPEPVLERPPYGGPTTVSMDLPEPFILKDEVLMLSSTTSAHPHLSQVCDMSEWQFRGPHLARISIRTNSRERELASALICVTPEA